MKKNLLSAIVCLTLCSCGNSSNCTSNENISSNQESVIAKESEIDSSINEEFADYQFKDDIVETKNITIGVDDIYSIRYIISKEYKSSMFEIYCSDDTKAVMDAYDRVIGLDKGNVKLTLVADEQYYDTIDVEILDKEEFDMTFKMDPARLINKTFTVFGDSISDTTTSAYETQPYFWSQQLRDQFNMTLYDHAKSGSTTGYTYGLVSRDQGFTNIVGTFMVNQKEVKEHVEKSDYVFIYFGNNDFTYNSNIGKKGDVNDQNYLTYESFRGSYSYIIDKVRSYNPTVKVVILGVSYSTWPQNNVKNPNNPIDATYIDTREGYSEVCEQIAIENNAKFIKLYDLWNGSNYQTYNPDGIHPLTVGYELIVERILNS